MFFQCFRCSSPSPRTRHEQRHNNHKNLLSLASILLIFLSNPTTSIATTTTITNNEKREERKPPNSAYQAARENVKRRHNEHLRKQQAQEQTKQKSFRYYSPTRTTRHQREMSNLEPNTQIDLNTLSSSSSDPRKAAQNLIPQITNGIEDRLTKIFEKARTPECRALIGTHFGYFLNSIGKEKPLPFHSDFKLENECPEEKLDFNDLPDGLNIGMIQNRTYQPDPKEKGEDGGEVVYVTPEDLKLCYIILTHNDPKSTIRLVETLEEDGHLFVIHVDGKSEETYQTLLQHFESDAAVHVIPPKYRVRVNWGGFSMVNATLQTLRYIYAVDERHLEPLDFHKIVHLASTSYPLASRTRIRNTIASYPLDANLLDVVFKPTDPSPNGWHYFVECDDAVHRIYRLPPLVDRFHQNNVDIYTASQWWIISRDFGYYLANYDDPNNTFLHQYMDYVQHVVVSDESFFGTVLRHTSFCTKHHNNNFLHLQFDRWENEIDISDRDEKKCLMPHADHCGRSPTTMTIDYLPILELTNDLFARKFLDEVDAQVKDVLDVLREREEEHYRNEKLGVVSHEDDQGKFDPGFEGEGVLIVAKDTVNNQEPLCMGLGDTGNKVRLVPCFQPGVRATLAEGWETGAVIIEETRDHNRWELGPCSSDGTLTRTEFGMNMTPGVYSSTGPRCNLKQFDGLRRGRCVDGESDRVQPGGEMQVFPCRNRWHQFLSFGNGDVGPVGSMHTVLPKHMVSRIIKGGKHVEQHLCVGVKGRGDKDEEEWSEDRGQHSRDSQDEEENEDDNSVEEDGKLRPLSKWEGKQIVTTGCSNVGAIVEWLFVPYIVEDDINPDESDSGADVNLDSNDSRDPISSSSDDAEQWNVADDDEEL